MHSYCKFEKIFIVNFISLYIEKIEFISTRTLNGTKNSFVNFISFFFFTQSKNK